MKIHIGIITLFPEMFTALNKGVTGRAIQDDIVRIDYLNPRDYSQNKHRNVDDRPYGGGPGMVMQYAPLKAAIEAAKAAVGKDAPVVYLSPQGKPLQQSRVSDIALTKNIILLCGRYEGIDQRVIDTLINEEISLGDYVLSGGELGAMVLVDALTRLIPGVLGHECSAAQDSFSEVHLLDHPHYTRPEVIDGLSVPDVLLCGHHEDIASWRLQQALGNTWQKRKDLLEKRALAANEKQLLAAYLDEHRTYHKDKSD